ncbi:MAG: penicillin-binding transpeptidase domain-containing protein, partial [Acutalibacteraceae bacterium]
MRGLKKIKEKLNVPSARVIICIILTLAIFAGFCLRLFDWQIVSGDKYRKVGMSSVTYSMDSDAIRGEILTSDGKGLAVNKTVYNIAFSKLYMDSEKQNQTIVKLFSLMKKCKAKWVDNLPIHYKNGKYQFDKESDDTLEQIRSSDFLDISVYSLPKDYIDAFCRRYEINEKDYSSTVLRNLISVRYNMEAEGYSYTNDYIFAEDVTIETVQAISENMQKNKGVIIKTSVNREYSNGTLAPHIVGTVGKITAEEYEENKDKNYGYNDLIGKFGIEQAFEETLKGSSGKKMVEKNSNGEVTNVVDTEQATPGNTVYLTIDSKLQKVANKALAEAVKNAHDNVADDCTAGGVVMLSVKDFSVLAASTYPSYDLSKYSNYKYYNSLVNDKTSPLFSRCFSGSFAPGSIFKPCVAIAALEENVINTNTTIVCTHDYDYYPTNVVKCLGYHGSIQMNHAMTVSCNYFFAETGRRLGVDAMYLYAEKFGLGEKTGVEISENTGILAGRDSKSWVAGNTVQAAIGQSDNAFTVAQLATYVATLANDGTRLKTHIVDKVTDYSRENTVSKTQKTVVDTLEVKESNLKAVKESMKNVADSPYGTAYATFGNYDIEIAAKTGTAENSGSDHTTFICYAPYDKPEVAIAVVLEHGAKGIYSQSVAKALLDEYFK